jgi:hypothetical protein
MHRYRVVTVKKLNMVEGTEWYWVDIKHRSPLWKTCDTKVDINRAWDSTQHNIKFSTPPPPKKEKEFMLE